MHFIPEELPVNDKAPSTDADWEEALKLFGVDRDDPLHRSSPSSTSRLCNRHRPLVPRRGMEGSDDSEAEDIDPTASMRLRKKTAFGVGGMISSPPLCNKSDADQWDGAAERRRMRAKYDEQGWLPGCLPSLTTKRRRRRVIRRLGLAGDAEADHERRTIIAHYMDLAQLTFDVDDVFCAVLREDLGYRYSMDPDAEPLHHSLEGTALSQFAVQNHSECTVIGDMSRDWRTRANPFIKAKGGKFIAAAPLLYPRSNPPVAFGCLVIVSKQSRTAFSEREQSMLLRLSSMLVYQLATFQSEILAEKASLHYEHSLSFLRRAVMPGKPLPHNTPTPRSKTRPDLKTRRSKRDKVAEIAIAESDKSDGPASPLDSTDSGEAQLPPFVVKSGPKDQLDAHRASHSSNADLYLDAATTLRNILDADALALVDMSDYNLYYRRYGSDALELDRAMTDPTHRSPLTQFLKGDGWPEELQPVVHHVPTSISGKTSLLASSSSNPTDTFDLSGVGSSTIISELLVNYLKHRQFWWDRVAQPDSPGAKLMAFCPTSAQTLLIHFMPTADGRIQHLVLATWDRPPSTFADSSAVSLPFCQIVGGLSTAALNLRRIRSDEARQISYSNMQAHQLRTPLHQILAITQLLRSTLLDLAESKPTCGSYMNSLQQVRDLIPMIDAIDTSGNVLHGIVSNILSFLDLKQKDAAVTPNSPRAFDSPSGGAAVPLLQMLEEVIKEAHADADRTRQAAMQSINSIETIFTVDPPNLGTAFTEDLDGSLRRALARILSNAYRFIEGEGCVMVRLTHLAGQDTETLKGCSGLCSAGKVVIEIRDTGRGMDGKFVREHLGEPWAKEDVFTTGSGLSLHLAFRIIDMMGGRMEVSSALGRGCLVRLEVPVPRRKPVMGLEADTATQTGPTVERARRKVAIVGFNVPNREKTGLYRLGDLLRDQYIAQGADIVDISEAELVVSNGEVEEVAQGKALMESTSAGEIIFFTMPDHQPHSDVISAAERHSKTVRRIPKPITPSVIRQTLAPARPSRARSQHVRYSSIDGEAISTPSLSNGSSFSRLKGDDPTTPPIPTRPGAAGTTTSWRPKGMCIEEAIATLSLGDYFSSTRRNDLRRTSSRTSTEGELSTPATSSGPFDEPSVEGTPATSVGPAEDMSVLESSLQDLEAITVLVVEDNRINRAILRKIVSKLPVEIVEAVDGVEAVEQFAAIRGRCVALLDINMPRMDGFTACKEMRALEAAEPWRGHAEIIAVTALSAEDEKRRGRDVGFDDWAVKPCSRAVITKLVETARKKLLGIVDEPDPEADRRYTI